MSISYLAYRPGATIDGERGRFEDGDGFTGTGNYCNTVSFDQTFAVKLMGRRAVALFIGWPQLANDDDDDVAQAR